MDWNSVDWERLDRFVAGQAPPDEMAALAAWVNSDPDLRTLASLMRTVGQAPDEDRRAWDVRSAWQHLHRRMNSPALPVSLQQRRRYPLRRALSAAAVLLLVAGASLWLLAPWHRDATSPHDVATRKSQTAVLELPDGSRVMLGPASSLRVRDPGASGVATSRDVYLEGEAYLEVKHDPMRPFRVRTAAGLVEDVGTEFVVSAYPDAPGMRVVVATGMVALYGTPSAARRGGPLLTLAHGDLAELAVNGVATVTHDVNLAPYLAWTRGDLAFDGTRLGDVVPALERWYDIDIRLGDGALAERRLTATFHRESLSQVLQLLALSLDVRVQRDGRSVIIAPSAGSHP